MITNRQADTHIAKPRVTGTTNAAARKLGAFARSTLLGMLAATDKTGLMSVYLANHWTARSWHWNGHVPPNL